MPRRDPLSPPLLTAAAIVAAIPAGWLALAADAAVSGAAGALAGFPWLGLSLSPSFTLHSVQVADGGHPAALWAVALLAGPVGSALLAVAVHALVEAIRSPAWLRVLAFECCAFALLRLPALLFAAVASRGRGPVDELYVRLGEPQSGRWSVGLLALLVLAATAAVVASRAVVVGRSWMRVDGKEFRRRLVRVLAGYPSVAALAGWSAVALWAAPLWMVVWLLLTLSALHVLVS